MGFFGKKAPVAAVDGEDTPVPEVSAARPGTTATELGLRTDRDKASAAYQRAQRAEAAYRAKRQARNARQDITAAKSHTGESWKQARLGLGAVFRVVKGLPGVMRERKENAREKADMEKRKKSKAKADADRKKLEERLKKAAEEEAAAGEGDAAAAEPAAEEEAAAA